MKRRIIVFLSWILALEFVVYPIAFAEQSVKVYSVQPDGSTVVHIVEDPAASKPSPIKKPGELIFEDYEDGDLKNLLGGESGSWNLTPDAEDIEIAAEVVEGGSQDSSHALKVIYDVEGMETAKVGFWTKLLEFNAREYDHLVFDVKGDEAAGFTAVFLVELKKYKNEERIDKIKGTRVVRGVTPEWQSVEIPLNLFTGLFDQTNPDVWKDPMLAREKLDELVINLESRRVTEKEGALYFDNFRFVKTGNPRMTIIDQPKQEGMKTPVRLEGVEYMKFLRERLGGFPRETHPAVTVPADDREFLMMIARDTWRFFDEITDREHHLPLDTILLGEKEPISEGGWIGDYTNVTNIGLYLMCLVSAYDLGFIEREEAGRRIKGVFETIDKLKRHESGFLYNYYDTTTLAQTSYFVSLVDSGWLDAGVYVVKNAFPEELTEWSEKWLASHNFKFFYDEVEEQMSHGYYAHLDVRSDYVYGSLFTEPRAASYIAIGRGDVPPAHWFRLVRTFPEEYSWQTQMPVNRLKKEALGYHYEGGYYDWKGIPFVPSWGGSMFEALMPTLIIDEAKEAPEGLGLNDAHYVDIHIRYTLEDLGYPVWGMSPCSVPEGGYSEYGVEVLGTKGYKGGVVSPHASVLALEFAPRETIANLRKLIKLYPIYGEYGFYDAVTVKTGLVALKYLALDQGMILIALNNYLNGGAVRNRFMSGPINEKARPLLREEKFFETSEASAS